VGILQQPANPPKEPPPLLQQRGTNQESAKIRGFLVNYAVGSSGNDFTVFTWQFNIISLSKPLAEAAGGRT
jgi:hypothetical protein